ncbi:hypothetical protein EVAR_101307_1 [Eumeta japonica]|uniref:Uncharacterized protein n=1 Tax=Eumeta variegata TaxID=151549 RepID=A0A4C2ADL4_EUMVA|nr:hypothetical protein EVAR_101307_1 [Eumeta japonica]
MKSTPLLKHLRVPPFAFVGALPSFSYLIFAISGRRGRDSITPRPPPAGVAPSVIDAREIPPYVVRIAAYRTAIRVLASRFYPDLTRASAPRTAVVASRLPVLQSVQQQPGTLTRLPQRLGAMQT